MKNLNLLSVDVETGGLNEKEHSLLEVGMIALINGEIGPKLDIRIKNDVYNVGEIAKSINGFVQSEHEKTALEQLEVLKRIREYALEVKQLNQGKPLMLLGRNVNFDVRFLKEFFKKHNEDFESYFGHHFYDLTPILFYLYQVDKIDIYPKNGDEANRALGLPIEPVPHRALKGAQENIDVHLRTLQLM